MVLTRTIFLVRNRHIRKSISVTNKITKSSSFSTLSGFDVTENPNDHYDVIIVGGGVVGSALANRLCSIPSTSQLSIGIINPNVPPPLSTYDTTVKHDNNEDVKTHLVPNARAYALSPASLATLGDDSIEKLKRMNRVAPYNRMQIWESNGPATLHFSYKDLRSTVKTKILGAVIEDGPLVSSLWDTIQTQKGGNNVHFLSPGMLEKVHTINEENISTNISNSNEPLSLTYKNTTTGKSHTITTSLLVGSDGANSSVRDMLGIPAFQNQYGRCAVTCTVKMSDTLKKTAFQRFFPSGPIALLPIWSNNDSDNNNNNDPIYANIVWSTTPEHAMYLKNLSVSDFLTHLNTSLQMGPTQSPPLFSPSLTSTLPSVLSNAIHGAESVIHSMNLGLTMSQWTDDPAHSHFLVPPEITDVIGPRISFDLKLSQAYQYIGGQRSSALSSTSTSSSSSSRPSCSRVVLVGDAAHTLHPMAGQGLNLGIGDVMTLSREIQKAVECGMDVGSPHSLFLKRYESERQLASSVVMGGVQFLHSAFGWESGVGVNARSIGMNIIGATGLVRKKLTEIATFGGGIL